jgi:hypothetical protein
MLKNKTKKISYLFIIGIVLITLFSSVILITNQIKTKAAPITGFNPGRIIDDIVFTNDNTMSVSQIQAFLNSKVPSCDTWGTQPSEYGGGTRAEWGTARGYPPPYTCLKSYTESGKNASQIIYDAAKEFSINPQVLIVLLQKEQGLVTDTWPLPVQYRTATGYGCPDTAPCDSQYYGLTNQLRWSGRMFRAILNNSPTWYTPYVLGNNYIRWNPNSSCGGSTVNIENRSTQALYNYTPYRPNQAALNAGYGTGDSCSSYGNRNFYLYFTDWFGSVRRNDTLKPHPDGTIVNLNSTAYLVQNNSLHGIANSTIFESHNYRWQDVKIATTGDRNLPISWSLNFIRPGVLYTGDSNGVYVTIFEDDQWVKQLVSYESFTSLGYKWSQVRQIPKSHLPSKTSDNIYTTVNRHPDGTLISSSGSVFFIDHGTKRYVSASVFESQRWKWNDIVSEAPADKLLPKGANMLLREGAIISHGSNLYVIDLPATGSEIKRPIGPWECYASVLQYTLQEAISIPTSSLPVRTGSNVTC